MLDKLDMREEKLLMSLMKLERNKYNEISSPIVREHLKNKESDNKIYNSLLALDGKELIKVFYVGPEEGEGLSSVGVVEILNPAFTYQSVSKAERKTVWKGRVEGFIVAIVIGLILLLLEKFFFSANSIPS